MDDIRAIRNRLGLTQIEFADKLGLHQSTISRLETGELPLDKRTSLAVQALLSEAGSDDVGHGVGNSPDAVDESPDNSGGSIGSGGGFELTAPQSKVA